MSCKYFAEHINLHTTHGAKNREWKDLYGSGVLRQNAEDREGRDQPSIESAYGLGDTQESELILAAGKMRTRSARLLRPDGDVLAVTTRELSARGGRRTTKEQTASVCFETMNGASDWSQE